MLLFYAELNESLSDLGLFDRQALIVVPHQQGTSYQRGKSAFSDQIDSRNTGSSSNGSNGGYFSYVKGFLSYFNPLSYFGGGANSSSSGQQSQNGMWEYSEFLLSALMPKFLFYICARSLIQSWEIFLSNDF